MPLPPVFVELKASTTEFKAKLAEAGAEVENLQKRGSSSFDKLATVGKGALLGVGAAAIGVGAASLELADKYEAAHARVKTALDNSGSSLGAFGGQLGKLDQSFSTLGYNQTQTEAAFARLTQATNDPKKAMADMGTVANLAAAKHLDLETAATIVGKVAEGNTTVLNKYGISLDLAGGKAKDVDKAHQNLDKAQQNLKDTETKLAATHATGAAAAITLRKAHDAVTDATTKLTAAQNGAGNGIAALADRFKNAAQDQTETFKGKIQVLSAQAENLGTKIGVALIPKIEGLMTAIMNIIKWFEKHTAVAKALGIVIATGLVVAIGAYITQLAIAGAKSAAEFVKMIANGAKWAAETAAQFAVAVAKGAWWMASQIANFVTAAASGIASAASVAAGWIAANAAMILATGGIALAIGAVVLVVVELVKHWHEVWTAIKEIITDAKDWIVKHINLILDVALGPLGFAIGYLKDHWKEIWSDIKTVIHDAVSFIGDRVQDIRQGFDNIVSFIAGVPERIAKGAVGMFDGIKNAFKSAINWLIRAWNSLDFKMPEINTHIPGVGKIGGFDVGVPKIPELADGAIVRYPTLATIGESQGRAEAVVPLGSGIGMGHQISVMVNSNADPYEIAQQVAWAIRTGS